MRCAQLMHKSAPLHIDYRYKKRYNAQHEGCQVTPPRPGDTDEGVESSFVARGFGRGNHGCQCCPEGTSCVRKCAGTYQPEGQMREIRWGHVLSGNGEVADDPRQPVGRLLVLRELRRCAVGQRPTSQRTLTRRMPRSISHGGRLGAHLFTYFQNPKLYFTE